MKLYNERLGKVIDGTPMMAKLLSAKGWVEVIGEPILGEPEVFEITVDEDEVAVTPIEVEDEVTVTPIEEVPEQENTEEVPAPVPEQENKPKADPVKKVKAKSKNKK